MFTSKKPVFNDYDQILDKYNASLDNLHFKNLKLSIYYTYGPQDSTQADLMIDHVIECSFALCGDKRYTIQDVYNLLYDAYSVDPLMATNIDNYLSLFKG